MVYQIVWNNGQIDSFPAERYSLQEVRDLRDEITLATRGTFTGRVDLAEVDA